MPIEKFIKGLKRLNMPLEKYLKGFEPILKNS